MLGALTFSPSEVKTQRCRFAVCPDVKMTCPSVCPQFFSLCAVEDLKLQRPALTSTPVCSLKHSTNTGQEESCLHCSHTTQ